ncbi:GntR family transcriptional regulator [Streptomyces sp. NBC_01465]|uniref:GntR family transcriptional regulator n=1 Tax=Streptomyces sp. NBC_01465 TaxID=2903878 RepID=UPI002E3371E5|nr:GntR family transcriptional regulator [Streptomyces sp. NBC_01465]
MSQNSTTSVNGRKPSHREVADTLRERIRSEELKAGDPMPTQAALVEEFGVERGTIRQALKILQGEGLLTHVTRGAPARIADRATMPPKPAAGDQPRPTMVELAARITEAFTETDVRIDAVSLTAESLNLALGDPIRRIHEGELAPKTIRVRILLPSREIELAFPTAVDDGARDQDAVHKRWLDQRNSQGKVLRHNLRALRASHEIDVEVELKALPFTPPIKLYLLNGAEALFAYYLVARREEEVGEKQVEIYDALGLKSLLFSFEGGGGGRDSAYVEESQKWFNALWDTISSELTLSE